MTVDKFVMTLNINGYADGELTVPDEVLSATTNVDVSGEDDTADDTTAPTSEEATETSEASTETE